MIPTECCPAGGYPRGGYTKGIIHNLKEIILEQVLLEEATPPPPHWRLARGQLIPQEIVPVATTTVSVSRFPGGRRSNAAKRQRLLSFSARNRLSRKLGPG